MGDIVLPSWKDKKDEKPLASKKEKKDSGVILPEWRNTPSKPVTQPPKPAPVDDRPWYDKGRELIKDYLVDPVQGTYEDYPELSSMLGNDPVMPNPQVASTPEGQVNILKNPSVVGGFFGAKGRFPNARIAKADKHGNPLVQLGENQFGYDPQQLFYMNRPGLSAGDWEYLKGQETAITAPLAVAAGGGTPALIPLMAAGGVITTGGELAQQTQSKLMGSGESYRPLDAAKIGGYAVAGEAIGRFGAFALPAAYRVLKNVFGKAETIPGNAFTPEGALTEKGVAYLESKGIDVGEFTAEMRRELGQRVDSSVNPWGVTESGNIPRGENISMGERIRMTEAQEEGVPLLKSDITGDFADRQFEREMAKDAQSGAPIRQVRDAQNQALSGRGEEIAEGIAPASTKLETGGAIKGEVRRQLRQQKDVVHERYDDYRDLMGGNTEVDTGNLGMDFEDIFDEFEDVMPAPIVKRFNRFGMGNVADDATIKPFNFVEAERLRKMLSRRFDPTGQNRELNHVIGKLTRSIDDAVDGAAVATGNVDIVMASKAARAERIAQAHRFEQKDIVEALTRKKSEYTDVVSDEVVVQKIFRAQNKVENSLKIKKALLRGDFRGARKGRGGTPEGQRAWDSLRGTALRDALDKATITFPNGRVEFSGVRFTSELDKYGDDLLKVLFTPGERFQIQRFRRVAENIGRSPEGAVNYSGTSSAVMNAFNRALDSLQRVPGIGIPVIAYRKATQVGEDISRASKAAEHAGGTSSFRGSDEARRRSFGKRTPYGKAGAAIGAEKGRRDR